MQPPLILRSAGGDRVESTETWPGKDCLARPALKLNKTSKPKPIRTPTQRPQSGEIHQAAGTGPSSRGYTRRP